MKFKRDAFRERPLRFCAEAFGRFSTFLAGLFWNTSCVAFNASEDLIHPQALMELSRYIWFDSFSDQSASWVGAKHVSSDSQPSGSP